MKCDLCGTKVKVVGDETKHYEPMVDKDMLLSILDKFFNADKNHVVKDVVSREMNNDPSPIPSR